jgi:hypothetical protein
MRSDTERLQEAKNETDDDILPFSNERRRNTSRQRMERAAALGLAAFQTHNRQIKTGPVPPWR